MCIYYSVIFLSDVKCTSVIVMKYVTFLPWIKARIHMLMIYVNPSSMCNCKYLKYISFCVSVWTVNMLSLIKEWGTWRFSLTGFEVRPIVNRGQERGSTYRTIHKGNSQTYMVFTIGTENPVIVWKKAFMVQQTHNFQCLCMHNSIYVINGFMELLCWSE